jgi:hypothetical protein
VTNSARVLVLGPGVAWSPRARKKNKEKRHKSKQRGALAAEPSPSCDMLVVAFFFCFGFGAVFFTALRSSIVYLYLISIGACARARAHNTQPALPCQSLIYTHIYIRRIQHTRARTRDTGGHSSTTQVQVQRAQLWPVADVAVASCVATVSPTTAHIDNLRPPSARPSPPPPPHSRVGGLSAASCSCVHLLVRQKQKQIGKRGSLQRIQSSDGFHVRNS